MQCSEWIMVRWAIRHKLVIIAAMTMPWLGQAVGAPQTASSDSSAPPVLAPGTLPGPGSVALWELSSARMSALLGTPPNSNEERYASLRQDFEDLGCVGSALEEQLLDHKGRRRNVVCTLPGEDRRPIVIIARYDEHLVYFDPKGGWADGVLLPVLYHGLSAEPHHNTLVFAAVDGTHGASHFFQSLRARGDPDAVVEVDLEAVGFTMPQFFAATPETLPVKERATGQIVVRIASSVAALQRRNADASWMAWAPFFGVHPSALSAWRQPLGCPVVSVSSGIGGVVTPQYFREAHDFVGFFVGGLDKALAGR